MFGRLYFSCFGYMSDLISVPERFIECCFIWGEVRILCVKRCIGRVRTVTLRYFRLHWKIINLTLYSVFRIIERYIKFKKKLLLPDL
jgi:hypothetical protein